MVADKCGSGPGQVVEGFVLQLSGNVCVSVCFIYYTLNCICLADAFIQKRHSATGTTLALKCQMKLTRQWYNRMSNTTCKENYNFAGVVEEMYCFQ